MMVKFKCCNMGKHNPYDACDIYIYIKLKGNVGVISRDFKGY